MTQQPRTLADVEEYAEQTASSMYYLSLETMGVKDVHADHVASHIGKAYGLTTLLRGVPFHASRKQIYLPMDLTTKVIIRPRHLLNVYLHIFSKVHIALFCNLVID